jgi:hypothetical protein
MPKLREMTMRDIAALRWWVAPDAIIAPPFASPIIADPTFLSPEQTGAGPWRLWAHSMFGLHSYTSDDGVQWRRGPAVTRNALRAFVLPLGSPALPDYYLAYEKTRLFLPLGLPWRSWIELRRSRDLVRWSSPRTLLSPTLAWHSDATLGSAVSNPCIVASPDGGWRMYYSAGLTLLPDCGFPEPTYIGVAGADAIEGPYRPDPEPMLGPDDGPASLAAGAIKVLRVADGNVGFQNAITWDGEHSSSAIWVLGSVDGLTWEPLADAPAVAPEGRGWMSDFVYALDIRDTPPGPRMYFNARHGHHWSRGRERIGYAIAGVPA